MTPGEIRKWDAPFNGKDVTAEVARARARIEIAAQLAELNYTLSRMLDLMVAWLGRR